MPDWSTCSPRLGAGARVAGTATIDGQQTTELTAQALPGELLRGGSQS